MYRYPRRAKPLCFIARAAASSMAASEVSLKKLQVLHPSPGLRSVPCGGLASAWAGDAFDRTDPTAGAASIGSASSVAVRPRVSLLMSSPRCDSLTGPSTRLRDHPPRHYLR